MDYIYQVIAKFNHGDRIEYILIGNFSDLGVANLYGEKWDQFFLEAKCMLNEPIDWDPSLDEWTGGEHNYGTEWCDSKEYFDLLNKHRDIENFIEIDINKLPFNTETFMNFFSGSNNQLMIQFDRDWKLNQLQK